MPKLADVPKLKVISSGASPIDTHLKYPNGTNFDKELYCYTFGFPPASNDSNEFSIIVYKRDQPSISKTFKFTGTDRLQRVRKHMDSLTNEQLKDFLNKTSR